MTAVGVVAPAFGGMTPPPSARPDVLPDDRLLASAVPVPTLRRELRRIPAVRNAVSVVGALVQSIGVVAGAAVVAHPVAYVVAFLLAGRGFALLSVLAHEGAHRLLFRNRVVNDVVGRWILAYPALVPFELYRRSHLSHHRDELGPDEPDVWLYAGYPVTKNTFWRRLLRDAFLISGWKRLRRLLGALTIRAGRPFALRILAGQVPVLVVLTLLDRPELYLALWLLPWMTVWQVLNRLRAVAEHGGMSRSDDKRATTHVVRQRPLARFWVVPYNTGYHLAHHVDMGVPFRNLPRLQRELVRSGWVTADIEYPGYLSLWRTLAGSDGYPWTARR